MSVPDPSTPETQYVIDPEEMAETARLIEQDNLITQAMGGLLPEQTDMSQVTYILDIACGPGQWVCDVALRYPHTTVVGIDINPSTVRYATSWAKTQRTKNARFFVMDAHKPLAFEDNALDLVNARLITGFMDQGAWPRLLAECFRIIKPGGIIRLTELEGGPSTSAAGTRLAGFFFQAMASQDRTFSLDGHSIGITHMLGRLLKGAGFAKIGKRSFHLDISYGMPLHPGMARDAEKSFQLLKPYITRSGLVDTETYDTLYTQAMKDMQSEDYTAISYGLTAWGAKPPF